MGEVHLCQKTVPVRSVGGCTRSGSCTVFRECSKPGAAVNPLLQLWTEGKYLWTSKLDGKQERLSSGYLQPRIEFYVHFASRLLFYFAVEDIRTCLRNFCLWFNFQPVYCWGEMEQSKICRFKLSSLWRNYILGISFLNKFWNKVFFNNFCLQTVLGRRTCSWESAWEAEGWEMPLARLCRKGCVRLFIASCWLLVWSSSAGHVFMVLL